MLSEALFQILFDLEGEAVLQQATDLLSVMPMTITDGEEMRVSEIQHVRVC